MNTVNTIYVTVNRVGKQYRIITQGPSMITEPTPSYAAKQEAKNGG